MTHFADILGYRHVGGLRCRRSRGRARPVEMRRFRYAAPSEKDRAGVGVAGGVFAG